MEPRDQIIALAIKYQGDWVSIFRGLSNKEFLPDDEARRMIDELNCQAITIIDDIYPEDLKNVRRPPFVLFYYGDISLITNIKVNLSVVGSRDFSAYGEKVTKDIVRSLPREINIVSGLARGIDMIAHRSALDSLHKTIAVLGSGIDVCYPLSNKDLYEEIKQKGLVISEYPPGVLPKDYFFPMRNRIVAGLSRAILITEAKRRSGTMITVLEALEVGHNVLCVPSGDLLNSGCNLCIKEGAFLVESADDVNRFYRF